MRITDRWIGVPVCSAPTPINAITLFGPETPARFAAPSGRNDVLRLGPGCRLRIGPLSRRALRCRGNPHMREITVDRVFKPVREVHEVGRQAAGGPA